MISAEKKAYNHQYYLDNKESLSQANKKYREANKDKLVVLQKERYQKNREEILIKQKEYSKKNVKESRERKLQKNGWTQKKYDVKFSEQKGVCAICRIPTAPLLLGGVLAADHEHVNPPKTRGLLCSRCNTGLGQFLDNPLLLIEASLYLTRYGVYA